MTGNDFPNKNSPKNKVGGAVNYGSWIINLLTAPQKDNLQRKNLALVILR